MQTIYLSIHNHGYYASIPLNSMVSEKSQESMHCEARQDLYPY